VTLLSLTRVWCSRREADARAYLCDLHLLYCCVVVIVLVLAVAIVVVALLLYMLLFLLLLPFCFRFVLYVLLCRFLHHYNL